MEDIELEVARTYMGNRTKCKIIGGMFGLEETPNPDCSTPSFLNGRDILLANARSGISLAVELLSPSQVWMPSYLCRVMVEAVPESAATVKEPGTVKNQV